MAHRSLDETNLVTALVAGTLVHQGYWGLLSSYQAFFFSWERRMRENHPGIVVELGAFRFERSEWLAADLGKFAVPPSMPVPLEPVMPADLAGLAGCLYVIEGSSLGGMHLSRSGRGFPNNAGRFFQGYGEASVPAWKAFIEWLEIHVPDGAGRLRAAATANETFGWFQREFTRMAARLSGC